MADKNHVHNYTRTPVENPQGMTSDGKRAVWVLEDHYFCSCGDFYTVPKGTVER